MDRVIRVRLSQSAVDAIKQMIADDGFAPGDKFYSENDLKTRLGVSRSSVREAVRILEAQGQLSVKHGKGIFITDNESQSFDAFVEWLKTNEVSLRENFEVRLMIEPQVARLSAINATPEDIAQLSAAHEQLLCTANAGNAAETIVHDREFHRLLSQATRNKVLFALVRSLVRSQIDGWISSLHIPNRLQKTMVEHSRILDAVKDRDGEKAMLEMTAHLNNALEDVIASSKR
ncbi:FadR/GntR family transcriptional regulator [Rhodobium gokarnense]|uniref:GntR family transcriptional repressor for pyruvate dehydrogenase complex n=1 Tax=Rhodobium gokarnense TaxID=364296 RepID=A0ABT3HEV3_9HYPH|nr:FadR/GntR family transcriptional regulator [Rhodobium gokarnense]MCW2308927.1 GntR family transcriptional repressor for pyruvate dehydrogenase complex [Rhodobium gokarnense]